MDDKEYDFLGCSSNVLHRNDRSNVVYCTEENWQSVALALSQELELLGYPPTCSNEEDPDGNLDIISLVNTSWTMLENYRSCLKVISDMEDRLQRVTSDVERLRESNDRYKISLETKERQLAESKEKERQFNGHLQDGKSQLKEATDECKRLTSLLGERDSRYNHEVKRMENEMLRLKGRLGKLLGEKVNTTYLNDSSNNRNKYSSIPAWIEMTSLQCNPDGKSRGKWKTEMSDQRKEQELAQRIIQEHQEMQEKVIHENTDLRESYYNFQYGLVKMLRENDSMLEESIDDRIKYEDGLEESDSSILLPLDISREQLTDTSDKVIQNVESILKRRQDKIDSLTSLLGDYKSVINPSNLDSSSFADTEDAIKFILKHKEVLQEQEEANHLEKKGLERRETELKIAETEFNIYKEKSLLDDLTLSTPVPLSNVSHLTSSYHEGPNWSLGKVTSTLPPSGKQSFTSVPYPGLKVGVFPTDNLHLQHGKRSSVSSKPRSASSENEMKRGSLSPNRMMSPLPFGESMIKFRRPSNPTKSDKPRPRSANLSPSPHRMNLPRSPTRKQDDRAKSTPKTRTGTSGSLSDSGNSSFYKVDRSGSHSPSSLMRSTQSRTLPRSSMVAKRLSSIEKGDVISRGTIVCGEGQLDIFSSGSEAENTCSTFRSPSSYTTASKGSPSIRGRQPQQTQRLRQMLGQKFPTGASEASSDNEYLRKRSVFPTMRGKLASDGEGKRSDRSGGIDLMSMSDSELGRHLDKLQRPNQL